MIAVALLAAHPGNVRRDLDLTPDFLASIAANGVLVPLRITADADGVYRVIDGHRRLAAAIRVGLTEVPADLAGAGRRRARAVPGHVDRAPAAQSAHPMEEADALFAAESRGDQGPDPQGHRAQARQR